MARKRKKTKRSSQIKGVVNRKPRIGFPSLQRLYTDACRRAKVEYPSILGIHECMPHVYRQPPDQLFRCFRYENYKQRFWDIDKEDYIEHAQSKGNFAGHVSILSDGQQDQPVIFIMRPTELRNRDHAHGLMMAVLFHELGHVDDITRGLHIAVDVTVDITAAEEYAHRFACERIIRQTEYLDTYMTELAPDLRPDQRGEWRDCVTQFYRVIMGFYIFEVLPKYAELSHQSVRQAAQKVLDSEDMASYRSFASSAMNDYLE